MGVHVHQFTITTTPVGSDLEQHELFDKQPSYTLDMCTDPSSPSFSYITCWSRFGMSVEILARLQIQMNHIAVFDDLLT
jgi:hypothetical protein